jgi:peptidoglycan-N-acetylglucosamine deacetylase
MKKILIILALLPVLFLAFATFIYKLMNSETFQIAGEIIPRVETNEKVVALTFDDGPSENADEILNTLKEKNVKATFYVMGENIEKFPEESKKIFTEGHELGNHSYSHQRMVFKSNQFIRDEVDKTNALILQLGYDKEITFRPPFGKKLIGLPMYLKSKNIKTITWDVEPQKALGADVSADQIVEYVRNTTKPGSIILIHPWYGEKNASRDSIEGVIDELKADGYQFLTVSELLKK